MAIQNNLDTAAACEPIAAVQGISASDGKTKWFAPKPSSVIDVLHVDFIYDGAQTFGVGTHSRTQSPDKCWTNNYCFPVWAHIMFAGSATARRVTNVVSFEATHYAVVKINGTQITSYQFKILKGEWDTTSPFPLSLAGQLAGTTFYQKVMPGETLCVYTRDEVSVTAGQINVAEQYIESSFALFPSI